MNIFEKLTDVSLQYSLAGMQYVGGFVGYSVPSQSNSLSGQPPPWTSNGNQANFSVSRPQSITLGNQTGSSLIALSSPETKTNPRAPATSGYLGDLHDLDFSLVGTQTSSQQSSSTQSSTTTKANIYPDISAAFRYINVLFITFSTGILCCFPVVLDN